MGRLVPAKEALRLWMVSDIRTLIKRATNGDLQYMREPRGTKQTAWYFETPDAKYERLNN